MQADFSDVRGFNYQPGFGGNAHEIWVSRFDGDAFRLELSRGVKYFPGLNTVRLWLSHEPFLLHRDAFLANFTQALDICASLDYKVIPVLFNNWHSIPDFGGISPEMINYWFSNLGRQGQDDGYVFRPYLDTMLTRFDRHPAVLAWDLCNEPFNNDATAILPWLQHLYDTAKSLGVSHPIGVSVAATLEATEKVDACSDIMMIHPYFANANRDLPKLARAFREKGKPVLATECGWGALDDERHARLLLDDLAALTSLGLGFLIHAFHASPVADLHRPENCPGPLSQAEYMALVNQDGTLRRGHEAINRYCAPAEPLNFQTAADWLEAQARRTIRASARRLTDGTLAFPPQIGTGYEAFWLRDFDYMIETCADAFSEAELRSACRLFVDATGNDQAAAVDCIRFTGEPIYQPGYGRMGSLPVADGPPFTVNVVWNTWQQTGDLELVQESMDRLVAALAALPMNPATGLVHLSSVPGQDRCGYGFTDTVGKRGDALFCSLLLIEAGRRLAAMLRALGRQDEARKWAETANQAALAVNATLWDHATGLYLAASECCRQPDIWGSAFAVWLGVAEKEKAWRIATYFKENYAGLCRHGQIRHLPAKMYWERACPPDTYQNGAYWATPTGWFVHTLALVDAALARQTVVDLADFFIRNGICEWSIGETVKLPGYVASVTLPLQGIRTLARS